MKKLKIWSMMMLIAMVLPLMVACGGDDNDASNQSNIVDGFNINTGRKLLRLNIIGSQDDITYYYNYGKLNKKDVQSEFNIEYDSKGRLSKVIITYPSYSEIVSNQEVLKIDYDLKVISVGSLYSNVMNFNFTLNKHGYISQFGNYSCTYDSYGYLTGVESIKDIWTLAYDEGELIKSAVNNLRSIQLYYFFYGEDNNNGDLLFYMNNSSTERYRDLGRQQDLQAVLCYIAYQAGLFGKITTHCTYLTKSNAASAIFNKKLEVNNKNFETKLNCSFVFE